LPPFSFASRLVSCILSHLIQSKILSELSGSIFLLLQLLFMLLSWF
jgi:hypothetical protein